MNWAMSMPVTRRNRCPKASCPPWWWEAWRFSRIPQARGLGELTQQLGALGQGLYLAKYSRDNEREADSLGHEYMVNAGYGSLGFVKLMEMLNSLNKEQPNAAQMLFSTIP